MIIFAHVVYLLQSFIYFLQLIEVTSLLNNLMFNLSKNEEIEMVLDKFYLSFTLKLLLIRFFFNFQLFSLVLIKKQNFNHENLFS